MPVILADSHGRHIVGARLASPSAWRACPAWKTGAAGPDLFGFKLQYTDIGLADMVASAATLVLGQAAEGIPIVLARGVTFEPRDGSAAEIYQPANMDLYG